MTTVANSTFENLAQFKYLTQDREHDYEPSSSMNCWKTLEQLYNWRLLRKVTYLSVRFYSRYPKDVRLREKRAPFWA
jgi:hypothetical protein